MKIFSNNYAEITHLNSTQIFHYDIFFSHFCLPFFKYVSLDMPASVYYICKKNGNSDNSKPC